VFKEEYLAKIKFTAYFKDCFIYFINFSSPARFPQFISQQFWSVLPSYTKILGKD
jgi:hypothetical protein